MLRKQLTWNSKPPHYPHKVQPNQLQYTLTCHHQQQIEEQSPETQMVNHKDQDQPEIARVKERIIT